MRTCPRATLLRPLTARRMVDLPDPDSPMSTQISPVSMARSMPAAPSTAPVWARISSRDLPWSMRASAFGALAPKTMSRFLNSTAGVLPPMSVARPALRALADAIEHDREEHDGEAGLETHRDVHLVERAHD